MFQVQLPVFQGPLELLLHLIEKKQLAITDLSLIEVTGQYMESVRSAVEIDLAALADFLVIGAKLLFIKSASLLPKPPIPDQPEVEDAGRELAQMLAEYRKYRDVSLILRARDELALRAYPRMAPLPRPDARQAPLELSSSELLQALSKVLQRAPIDVLPSIERRKVTVDERIGLLRARLAAGETLTFGAFVADCQTRELIVVSFLSVLELVKAGEVEAYQESLFGEILIVPAGKESTHASLN
ncbi:MAG: segregation/condensation protein A [Dehalococcoidia bacterium]|nr:segregation/condensation protein A [Dehalococcoidia bacterium]